MVGVATDIGHWRADGHGQVRGLRVVKSGAVFKRPVHARRGGDHHGDFRESCLGIAGTEVGHRNVTVRCRGLNRGRGCSGALRARSHYPVGAVRVNPEIDRSAGAGYGCPEVGAAGALQLVLESGKRRVDPNGWPRIAGAVGAVRNDVDRNAVVDGDDKGAAG